MVLGSKSWHAAAPLPAGGQSGIYRKNDTQLPTLHRWLQRDYGHERLDVKHVI
jgi:hypothetical protein